jgi:hypothetical protein
MRGGKMKKLSIVVLMLCASAATLFGFDVTVPNEVPSYKDLTVSLNLEAGLKIAEARFYLLPERKDVPQYAKFKEDKGKWSVVIPFEYLKGEELIYYVQIRTDKGEVRRFPDLGTRKARLVADTVSPALVLSSPETKTLLTGQEQMVIFTVKDESEISSFSVLYKNKLLTKAAVFQDTLTFFISPTKEKSGEATVEINLADSFGNATKEVITFALEKGAEPFFSAEADHLGSLEAEYSLTMGESANTLDIPTFLADMQHDVTLDYEIGGSVGVKAGPLRIKLSGVLADDISVFDIPAAFPNSHIADFQNIMNLWHPWNFADEFDYTGEVPRKFYNENQFLARVSLFDPILSYSFGDQKLTYQKETIKDFEFRGTAVALNTPFLDLTVAKGLSDLGLYQSAWPQNFFGLQAGIGFFDYWWLQTNVNFISSLQGRYADIASSGVSAIGTLYDLGAVKPEESLVFGLNTGSKNKFFNLSLGMGLTLYTDDATGILDTNKLASDINDAFGFDISPYLGYVDTVNGIFPVFDYFPLTTGLTAAAVSRDLWGITYGGDLEVPMLGIEGWFHKTDGSYKSLGAAVDTDVMDWGAAWEKSIKDYDIFLSYNWLKDNIPDILFNDILPLFGMASSAPPSEYDISNLSHIVDLSIGTPTMGSFGNLLFTYTFDWTDTNASALAAKITNDAAAAAAILNSTYNDATMANTAGLKWKSGRLKFGKFIATLGAATENSHILKRKVDGATLGSTEWDFAYAVDGSLQYDRYKVNAGFEHGWSTEAGSDSTYEYDLKFSLLKSFFDTLSLAVSFDQTYANSILEDISIGGNLSIGKRFGILSTNASVDVGYVNSMVDNARDALTASVTITGGISF